MNKLLTEKDRDVLSMLKKLGGESSPHRIGAQLYGAAGRPDVKVRGTLQRLERLGYVKRSSWLERLEEWTLLKDPDGNENPLDVVKKRRLD